MGARGTAGGGPLSPTGAGGFAARIVTFMDDGVITNAPSQRPSTPMTESWVWTSKGNVLSTEYTHDRDMGVGPRRVNVLSAG